MSVLCSLCSPPPAIAQLLHQDQWWSVSYHHLCRWKSDWIPGPPQEESFQIQTNKLLPRIPQYYPDWKDGRPVVNNYMATFIFFILSILWTFCRGVGGFHIKCLLSWIKTSWRFKFKSKKTFIFLKTPSNVGGTFIKKRKKTTDLLEKWTEHNKKLHTMAHSTMIKYCRADFHDVIFRFLLLSKTSIFGSNGTLVAWNALEMYPNFIFEVPETWAVMEHRPWGTGVLQEAKNIRAISTHHNYWDL